MYYLIPRREILPEKVGVRCYEDKGTLMFQFCQIPE